MILGTCTGSSQSSLTIDSGLAEPSSLGLIQYRPGDSEFAPPSTPTRNSQSKHRHEATSHYGPLSPNPTERSTSTSTQDSLLIDFSAGTRPSVPTSGPSEYNGAHANDMWSLMDDQDSAMLRDLNQRYEVRNSRDGESLATSGSGGSTVQSSNTTGSGDSGYGSNESACGVLNPVSDVSVSTAVSSASGPSIREYTSGGATAVYGNLLSTGPPVDIDGTTRKGSKATDISLTAASTEPTTIIPWRPRQPGPSVDSKASAMHSKAESELAPTTNRRRKRLPTHKPRYYRRPVRSRQTRRVCVTGAGSSRMNSTKHSADPSMSRPPSTSERASGFFSKCWSSGASAISNSKNLYNHASKAIGGTAVTAGTLGGQAISSLCSGVAEDARAVKAFVSAAPNWMYDGSRLEDSITQVQEDWIDRSTQNPSQSTVRRAGSMFRSGASSLFSSSFTALTGLEDLDSEEAEVLDTERETRQLEHDLEMDAIGRDDKALGYAERSLGYAMTALGLTTATAAMALSAYCASTAPDASTAQSLWSGISAAAGPGIGALVAGYASHQNMADAHACVSSSSASTARFGDTGQTGRW